jgi:chromosome partitioning protein
MRTIAIVNQKGGCGKTTVSINLASALAEVGKKTLLVDLDPQAHCAVGLAVPEDQIEQSIYDVLISKSRGEPIRLKEILWQIGDRLELAPASIDLSAFEQQMVGIMERESCLRNVLVDVKGDYDYAIVDCPPAVGLLTFNALRASTDVVVPVETGYFALHGLSKQLETLSILCKRCSQQVNVRVLASMYDIRTKMAREILGELRSHFGDKMLRTVVNFNTKIKEAASFGQPISEYDPASRGQADFRALAEEIVSAEGKGAKNEMVNTLAGQLEKISSTADELLREAKIISPRMERKAMREPALSSDIPVPSQTEIKPLSQPVAPAPVAPAARVTTPSSPPRPITAAPKSAPAPAPIAMVAAPSMPAAAPPAEQPKQSAKTMDEKLSDYYGVNQIDGAVMFVSLYPHAKEVYIAGDFNSWHPGKTQMQKVGNSGIWQTKLQLPPGKYQYRLVVDGRWQQDPYNETTQMNPYGELNSVLEVR